MCKAGCFIRVMLPILAAITSPGMSIDPWREDPFMGDYQGSWQPEGRKPQDLVAQVIPRGNGRYLVVFLPEFDQRCPPFGSAEASVRGDALVLEPGPWSGKIVAENFSGMGPLNDQRTPFSLARVVRPSPRLDAAAPSGAIVLFDGENFDHWTGIANDGTETEITWKLLANGAMEVAPTLEDHSFATSIGTRDAYQDFHLHLEFRLPLFESIIGQSRGNSGIIFEDYAFVELQVLDSYGLPGYYDECGGIYKVAAPHVNMCRPPHQWQSYDIIYHAARYTAGGALVSGPRITVDHNGRRIQTDLEIPVTEAALNKRLQDPGSRMVGRIKLQNHGDPVQYRNVWLMNLKPDSRVTGKASTD